MKNRILQIILLIFVNSSFSQGTSNYLDETSEWRFYRGGWGESVYSTFYIDGNQVINGNLYYKTYSNEHKIETNIYFGGTTITDTMYGPGYLRESNGQFLLYDASNDSETIWFNNQTLMNSQIGDTYYFQGSDCTIESIVTNFLGSVPLKRIGGTNLQGYTGAIEGIGSIGSVCSAGFEYTGYLGCYSKQGSTIQFGDIDCSTFPTPIRVNLSVNSNEYNENVLNVFPNPTNGIVKVNSQLSDKKYRVYDIRGLVIKEGVFYDEEQTIDMSNYVSGIYILKVAIGNKTQYCKIVKK